MKSPGLLPFGEFRPDVSDYEGQHSKDIINAVPHGDGYGPFFSFKAVTSALASACRGGLYALKNDGSVAIFAGTSTKLYMLNNTNSAWTDVSRSGGSYTALSDNRNWSMVQFNNYVVAVNGNNNPQVFDLTSSTAFADLGGSPPQADFATIVNRFLVLSGLASPNVYRVQWSGLNAITTWDNVTNLSNYQDMADGGVVRGVAGGEYGTIFQDTTIRRMVFQPGSSLIFGIDRISANDGLFAPYSLVSAGDRIFWYSPTGFKMMLPGLYPQPIGKEKVDRTFQMDVDQSNLQLMIGSADPRYQRVYFAYKSVSGVSGLFDKILCYDWVLDRWSVIYQSGEYILPLSQPGLTLEGVDVAYANPATPVAVSSFTLSTGAGDTFTVASSPAAGQGINFSSTGTLPSGYTAGTPYYVKSSGRTSTKFHVSASGGVGGLEGSAVTSTSSNVGSFSYYQPSLEGVSIATFDSIATGQTPSFAAFDATHSQGYFNSSAMQATLETAEHGSAPQRIYINGFRPITDAPGVTGALSYRETEQSTSALTSFQTVNAQGYIPQRVSTRYARGHIVIPAGTSWSFAAGVEPDVSQEGMR